MDYEEKFNKSIIKDISANLGLLEDAIELSTKMPKNGGTEVTFFAKGQHAVETTKIKNGLLELQQSDLVNLVQTSALYQTRCSPSANKNCLSSAATHSPMIALLTTLLVLCLFAL